MIPVLLFLGSFLVYLVTLNGTIPAYRDSGDLISAIYSLGIAHPPGYPLYVVTGKLFIKVIPFANAAYRVNLFSAFCAAASVVLLYEVAKSQLRSSFQPAPKLEPGASFKQVESNVLVVGAALGAVILYAISPAVMALSRVAEMYTMAALFAAVLMACYLRNTPQSLRLGSFVLGCGFGVHPTLLFLAPLFVPRKAVLRESLIRLGFFALGASVIFIPLFRSWAGPVQNWGNPSTLHDLWRLITRSNYGGLKLHPVESQFSWTPGSVLDQAVYFYQALRREWGWLGLCGGLLGLLVSFRRSKALAVSWLLAGPFFFILSNLPLAENTTGPILQPYLVLVNVIWTVWTAQGIALALAQARTSGIQALLLTGLVTLYVMGRDRTPSYRDHFYAYDLGRNILRTLPAQAVLYDPDDPIAFTLRSLQLLENRRNDVVLLNFFRTYWGYHQIQQRWPDLLPPGSAQNAQELEHLFWGYSLKRRPFYADLPMKVPPPVVTQPEGVVYRIVETAPTPTSESLKRAERYFPFYVWRGSWHTSDHPDFFTQHIFNYRAAARCNLGLKYAERRDWPAARERYWESLAIDPHLAAAYNDLGVADYEQQRYVDAVQNYKLALRYDPPNAGFRRNLDLAEQAAHRR